MNQNSDSKIIGMLNEGELHAALKLHYGGEDPVKLNIRAEAIIDGDRLSGTVHLGAFGQRIFSGARKIT